MEPSLNLHCPACGAAVVPQLGCCRCCLTRAVQLQAARFGTELSCGECGTLHVVLRSDASRDLSALSVANHLGANGADWQIESFGEPDDKRTDRGNPR